MNVFHGFESLPHFTHPIATVGSYDGVHLGHHALIGRLVAEAREVGGESIVLTFDPHPRIILGRSEGLQLLTTLEEKITLFAQLGVDHLIVIPFDATFSALSGAEFIQRYIVGRIGAEGLVVGYNHRFGHDRIDYQALGAFRELRIIRVEECRIGQTHISSTVIRQLLAQGNTAEAERLLGRPLNENLKSIHP